MSKINDPVQVELLVSKFPKLPFNRNSFENRHLLVSCGTNHSKNHLKESEKMTLVQCALTRKTMIWVNQVPKICTFLHIFSQKHFENPHLVIPMDSLRQWDTTVPLAGLVINVVINTINDCSLRPD